MTWERYELSSRLETNLDHLREVFRDSGDFVIREFTVGACEPVKAAVIFFEGLYDKKLVVDAILKPLILEAREALSDVWAKAPIRVIRERILCSVDVKELTEWRQLIETVLDAEVVLLVDGSAVALALGASDWEDRPVMEPLTESTVRGPRHSFNETLRTNTALLRRAIKSPLLKMESLYIGRHTRTHVVLAYLERLADGDVLAEVHRRLDRIEIDGVLESGYLEELIEDNPYSPFPTVEVTERPDKVAAALLEGRIAIMTDGTPAVLLVPTLFIQFLQASEDYYVRYPASMILRGLRLLVLNFVLILPSLYIAVTTYHQEMLPTPLLISIAGAREGVPFPALVEAFTMELAFELLREAGLRLPRVVGQAVSIVGALVIGEAAVRAGLVGSAMVIVVAFTGIASFALPAYHMTTGVRLLRFPMMIMASILGFYGIMLMLLWILIHLMTMRSFGVPYLSPLGPSNYRELIRDVLMRAPWWAQAERPRVIGYQDPRRQAEGLKPRPPKR
ncbi:hypothetical protein SY88_04690 [Clostridiales bacterium PH28_bin88]|nr:hypothetical protein SY88_04690 [Clostridiales bacterium PH28_bin88]